MELFTQLPLPFVCLTSIRSFLQASDAKHSDSSPVRLCTSPSCKLCHARNLEKTFLDPTLFIRISDRHESAIGQQQQLPVPTSATRCCTTYETVQIPGSVTDRNWRDC